MPQFLYIRSIGSHSKPCQQGFVIHVIRGGLGGNFPAGKKPLMIERFKERLAFRNLAQPVEPHGVESLENIPVLAMAGRSPVLVDEALDFLETGNDALFARRAAGSLPCFGVDTKLGKKGIVIFGELISHSPPPLACVRGRQHLRPCVFPRRR